MKTFKAWLTTIAALLCSLTASAHDFEVGGIYYKINSSTDLTVRVTYKGYSENAYYNEYTGTVIIPKSVTYNSNTYRVTEIAESTFSGCDGLTSITIPESMTEIRRYAFNGCTSLTEVIIEDGSTTLSLEFNYLSLHNLGEGLFYDCPLEKVYLGRNLSYSSERSYGYSPFYNTTNKLTSVTISESVTSIGSYAFYDCSSLTSFTIPKGSKLTSIGKVAFRGCSSLTAITLPESVTSIGSYAFYDCSSLTSITLPESVTSIGSSAFNECSSITSITCEAITPPTISSDTFEENTQIRVYVPYKSIEAYKNDNYWSEFTNILTFEEDFIIDDQSKEYANDISLNSANITYTRTFNNTNWQALYVPFEIPVTEEFLADFEVADLNDVRQYDRDDDGVKDETVIEAFKITSGVLEANYPYLIRAREAGEKTITVTDATLFAAEENSIDCSSVRDKFTFTGTYSRLSSDRLPQGEGYYALSGGVWQPVAEGASLGAFRFYLKVDSRNGVNAAQSNAIRMRIIGEDSEEDGATGIDNSGFNNQNSELIFDLQGRRVENPTKGVYIVNGVKRVF